MLGLYSIVVMGFGLIIADPFFYEVMKETCHFIYGEPLGQWQTLNDIQCVRSCKQHGNCTSMMYEKASRQCFLNAEIQEDGSQFPEDCGVQYAEPVVRFFGCGDGWQDLAGRCYLYVDQRLTWQGCDDYCIGEKSYLAKLYNVSTYSILYNATRTGWNTAMYDYYPWVTVNDLFEEGIYTDRNGVPINPELYSTVTNYGLQQDCGRISSSRVYLDSCNYLKTCLCEKDPGIIVKRPNRFI